MEKSVKNAVALSSKEVSALLCFVYPRYINQEGKEIRSPMLTDMKDDANLWEAYAMELHRYMKLNRRRESKKWDIFMEFRKEQWEEKGLNQKGMTMEDFYGIMTEEIEEKLLTGDRNVEQILGLLKGMSSNYETIVRMDQNIAKIPWKEMKGGQTKSIQRGRKKVIKKKKGIEKLDVGVVWQHK